MSTPVDGNGRADPPPERKYRFCPKRDLVHAGPPCARLVLDGASFRLDEALQSLGHAFASFLDLPFLLGLAQDPAVVVLPSSSSSPSTRGRR